MSPLDMCQLAGKASHHLSQRHRIPASTAMHQSLYFTCTLERQYVTSAMMQSNLQLLPVEVFDIVALDLDLLGYQNLRLSSRQLYSLSLSTFAKRYFSELSTSLGSTSLDRLVNISKHEYLAEMVSLLDIKLLNHRDYKVLTTISRIGIFPPPKRFPKVSAMNAAHISGDSTLYSDVLTRDYPACIVDRLTRALQGYNNLKIIRFRTHHTEPIGWRKMAMPEGDQHFRTKCFQAVLDAVLKSEIQLEEFTMSKARKATALAKAANLIYPTLQLPFTCHLAIRHCFTNLQSLTLSVVTAFNGDCRVPGWENGLSHLIACAPNVKRLALSLDRPNLVSHYSAAVIRSLASSCRLEMLETFHFVNCSLHEADLATLLVEHTATLQHLILADVRLLTGSWTSLFTSLLLCKELAGLRLASLEGVKSPVIFKKRGKEKPRITLDAGKSGRDIQTLLGELITACQMETDLPTNVDVVD